jgi:hypothetical protein
MLTYTKLKHEDLTNIDIQPHQEREFHNLYRISPEFIESTDARTYRDENGKIIFMGGFLFKWHNHVGAWALFAKDAGKNMTQIFREWSKWLDEYNHVRRVECLVDAEFWPAIRLAYMLKFKLEAKHQYYFENGNDALLFTRIN